MQEGLKPASVTVEELDRERTSMIAQAEAALFTYHRCVGAKTVLDDLIRTAQDRLVKEIHEKATEENRKLVEAAKAEEAPKDKESANA